jgi:hypothetical protein
MLGFRTIGCAAGVTLIRNVGTLPQSANRMILPVYISWERSMLSGERQFPDSEIVTAFAER